MKIRRELVLIVAIAVALVVVPTTSVQVHGVLRYNPQPGDYFNYTETSDLSNAVGPLYQGYTEHWLTIGGERMNRVFANGTVAAAYGYTYTWNNNSGTQKPGGMSGNFSYSSTSFKYTEGTDNQTGFEHSTVWFYIDNTVQNGGTFALLGTPMTVQSASSSYSHTSATGYVSAIFAAGTSSYSRNDIYGKFNVTYTWDVYFDPSTGYIIGYSYVAQDTSSRGDGFTWTDIFSVTTTSYALTAAPAPSTPGSSPPLLFLALAALLIGLLIILIVAAIVIRRSRRLPKHPYSQYMGPAPPTVDLTPKQPPAQQIVIKEVVKVKCQYCGALIDSTVQRCPFCGAPRT